MKLLLTSDGISNKSISDALFDLVGKKPEDTRIVFIPTASHVEIGDKTWLIDHLINLKELQCKEIEIADISAIEEKIWRPKIENADVIYFGGGGNYHLMRWINKSGLGNLLPELLKTKVYVGGSAGSMVTNKTLDIKIAQIVYDEELEETESMMGLGFVDFYFLPHLNSPDFIHVREDFIKDHLRDMKELLYALDDEGALKVVEGNVEVISEGKWLMLDQRS